MSKDQVVVGVDGSEEARAALIWAAREASLRNCRLLVVHAFDNPWTYWDAGDPLSLDEVQAEQRRLLKEEVAYVENELPDDALESEIVNDLPARALLDRSKDAAMVVVGSRGRGGFSGLLLGSVSQQVVHHAHCPVVVVPHRHHDD